METVAEIRATGGRPILFHLIFTTRQACAKLRKELSSRVFREPAAIFFNLWEASPAVGQELNK